jgi:Spx/MgsR family transcriptional regulator
MIATKKKSAGKSNKGHSRSVIKKSGGRVEFLQKPTCTSCRNARAYMEKCGFDLRLRDIGKDRLRPEEIENLIGDRDHREFLNARNELYRRHNMKENPPTRAEAVKMIAAEPNLIRRPIIIVGKKMILGFDPESIDNL